MSVIGQILLRRIRQQVGERDNTDASMEAIPDVHADSVDDLPMHELPSMKDSGYSSFRSSNEEASCAMYGHGVSCSLEPGVSPKADVLATDDCRVRYSESLLYEPWSSANRYVVY